MTNKEFATGLRELADLYEADERMAQPNKLEIYLSSASPEVFRNAVRALAVGGKVDKVPPRDKDEYFYHVTRTLPSGLVVDLITPRSSVCRRVKKMELVETWECPDSILDPDSNAA